MNDEKIWLAIVMCAVATLIFCNGWLPQIDAFIYNRGSWWVSDHIDEEVVLVHQEDRLIFQESNLNKSTNVTLTRMLQSICAGKPKAVVSVSYTHLTLPTTSRV